MLRPGVRLTEPGVVDPSALRWGDVTVCIYQALALVAMVVASPILLWRFAFDRRYRTGLRDRMGAVPRTEPGRRCVWIHGVSVGEVKGAAEMIRTLEMHHPGIEVVVSTTTSTGQKIAREIYPHLRVIYYPLDFGTFPGRALDRVRPCCVLLMELEIWPNFLQAAARRSIPVAVINGRISERSFRGYRFARWLIPQFDYIDPYCVQIEEYRQRLIALRVPAERIIVTGNMKYDGVSLQRQPASSAALRAWLAVDGRGVLVCGSTHGREDEWVAGAVARLCTRRPAIRLVTVPRHPERAGAVVETLRGLGFRAVLWSAIAHGEWPTLDERDVVVVDTVGRLEAFYGACDVAFVGGSLVPHGGQNMLEPAALGRAVVFGPHTENFRTDVDLLLSARAAIMIQGPDELEGTLDRLFADPDERARLAERAIAVIGSNQGATARTLGLLAARFGQDTFGVSSTNGPPTDCVPTAPARRESMACNGDAPARDNGRERMTRTGRDDESSAHEGQDQ